MTRTVSRRLSVRTSATDGCSLSSSSVAGTTQTVGEGSCRTYWRVDGASVATNIEVNSAVLCQWPILEVVVARFLLTGYDVVAADDADSDWLVTLLWTSDCSCKHIIFP